MSENTENKSCVVPIGPYHPLQEEPEFFKLHVDGEKVVGIDIEIGYNHRGIEKISEAKHYDQGIFAVERICGICSTSHPFAYCNAVEDLAGIELPERARYIRTLVGELERIHSHLLWLGLAGHFLGYNTVWMWSWKYREPVLDIFEKISGNRQHYSMFKIGGVRRDILAEDIPWIEKELDALIKAVEMFKGAVMDDPVILARTKNIGVLTAKDIKDYGGVGPLARASGVDIDIRRDNPYAAYNLVDWKVQTFQGGDIFAKAVVRILETLESIKIIQQCLVRLKTVTGPIDLKIKEIPAGEGIGRHEAPRGEVFHYVRGDKTNRPTRHKIRAPSYVNVATNEKAVIGYDISDALIVLAAVDPCYCCTERVSVVDAEKGTALYTGNDLIRLSQEKTKKLKERIF
ncbi:MAG TPA: NADH:ubiquinone oxidoreductase [Elusimicrobia bacterium]|nr:MAG: NADH:ubiquinone oxidoreductase [Elusimicrobia bacterium RIFOXYA12_FULL_49_49]OGS16002.1 MAG: NADH:ubiquinone oxidoreductase [Elusimicrobia bacterium RIFOXYA2_FULL_47_53]OGS26318.1 MAG: NADH:ubiquinone oxidoreductase [Elusimicrobia bacterium RIFOXYB12_FULL_50_12]OGS29170.1 MAG: NADH:ubiquinone oxidoreductase [Elusimicrobia bacterium RIFOXYB2_FULL_46_23]HBU69359.1 NADH:ubiquinone oxidoreductase [Elusimicrobiota bacterium]